MSQAKKKHQALLNELINAAQGLDIEVRSEKLFREVGYFARSGSCRLHEKRLIILDRDLPFKEQVGLLTDELRKCVPDSAAFPPHLRELL